MDVNDNIVGTLSSLLNRSEDDVKTALSAEKGLNEMVTSFKNGHKIMSVKDYDKLTENLKVETKEEIIKNLKPNDLPTPLADNVSAWKLGEKEREIAEKFDFKDRFNGIVDLVSKIIDSRQSTNNNADEVLKLKERITELNEEHNKALLGANQRADEFIADRLKNEAIHNLNLDYEDDALPKQEKLIRNSFDQVFEVKPIDRGGQKVFAVYKRGEKEFMMDEKRDPMPLDSIVGDYAKEFGFKMKSPDVGGQGGKSSSNSSSSNFAGWTEDQMKDYIAKKGYNLMSKEGTDLWQQFRKANQK